MRPPAMLATTGMTQSPWNLRKVQGQIRICETSVVTHFFVDLTHQIIHQRWTPTSRLIVHVLSLFIEHPNPFPNHAITQRIVTIFFSLIHMRSELIHKYFITRSALLISSNILYISFFLSFRGVFCFPYPVFLLFGVHKASTEEKLVWFC